MIQLDALQTIDRTNKLCWCRFELLLPILCYLTICPDFIFLLFTCCFNSSKLNLNFIWRWCWGIDVSIKKLEKLEAAKVAYLWLPFVTFCYLSLPFVFYIRVAGGAADQAGAGLWPVSSAVGAGQHGRGGNHQVRSDGVGLRLALVQLSSVIVTVTSGREKMVQSWQCGQNALIFQSGIYSTSIFPFGIHAWGKISFTNSFPRKVSFNFSLKETRFSVWRVNCKLFRMTMTYECFETYFSSDWSDRYASTVTLTLIALRIVSLKPSADSDD